MTDFESGPIPGPEILALPPGRDLWVFAYGSLMWDPGFVHAETRPALLRGYHREFCVSSHRYRGTLERPGLVLGLDRGGSCRGLAFRVEAATVPDALAYLWDREMSSGVYRPRMVPISTAGGRLLACAFLADPRHRQYCGALSLDDVAGRIRECCGERGPNIDYLANTVVHLHALGIRDARLEALHAAACGQSEVPCAASPGLA
ncbi:gamma-glutamylcyclotransferase [Arenibaculum pallidiluteum]|uniref:gamma-glutamylcyclotransferase n=1 Tax=Arenibaculum pallidiluteum TaxID=2812559 RepID=UPI002E2CCF54|nr:gamma-glutamylcyclotransferase [Arenibaculum pallidiluteum]